MLILIASAISGNVAGPLLGIASWNIPSGSMRPTLQVGDHLNAQKNYYVSHALQRGDIALFSCPPIPASTTSAG